MRAEAMMRFTCVLLISAVLVYSDSGRLSAGSKPPAPLPAFTPQREAAALQFVEQHHPELGQVLARLKKLNQEQYEQAIRQIFQESASLAAAKANDEKLHELMLEAWKVRSRIQVLAAQLACASNRDPEKEAELKRLLYRQVDLQRQNIEYRRDKALASVKIMETNIKTLEDNRDSIVERHFGFLTRSPKKANNPPPGKSATPTTASPNKD
jgi:hypothetical protein